MELLDILFTSIFAIAIVFGLPYGIGESTASHNRVFEKSYKFRKLLLNDDDINNINKNLSNKRFNAILCIITYFSFVVYGELFNVSQNAAFGVGIFLTGLSFYFLPQWGHYQGVLNLLKPMDENTNQRVDSLLEDTNLKASDFFDTEDLNNLKRIHFYIIRDSIEKAKKEQKKKEKEEFIKDFIRKDT